MDQKSGNKSARPVKALPANGVVIGAAGANEKSPIPSAQPGSARRSSKSLLPKLGKDGETATGGVAITDGSGAAGAGLNKNPSAKSLVTASPPTNGHPANGSGEYNRPASGRALRTGSIKGSPFALLKAQPPAPSDAEHEKQRLEDMAAMNQGHTVVHTAPTVRGEADNEYEDLDRRVLKSGTFRDLYRIVRMCSAQPSCHRMVLTLEREALKLVGASCVRIFLVGRDGLTNRTRSYELGVGIVGHVIRTKDLINIVNPAQDDRYLVAVDELPKEGAASALMCLPVEADTTAECDGPKDIVAVIQAFKHEANASFSSRDCRVLYRLGEFAGNLLRNSRNLDRAHALYSQATISHKRSQALLDVAKALSSEHQLNRIIGIIVSQVPELLDADRCTLFFVDKEKQQLVVKKGASQGRKKSFVSWVFGQFTAPELPFEKGSDEIRFSMHSGIAGFVATGGETLNLLDAHLDPRFNPKYDKETGYRTRSVLCVPMVDSNGEIIGVLQTINKNPLYPRFNEEDETLVKTFSAQAALAVRNSQLLERTETARKQSEALLEVTNALSSELKIEELVKIIVVKVQQLLECERCTVFIVDRKRQEMYTSANMSHGLGAPLPINREKSNLIYFPMDRGIAGRVATTGQKINIPDAYKDERFNKSFDTATGFRTKSILCMPIRNHVGEVIGVTQSINKMSQKARFMDEDERLLGAFNAQSAVAIENSRLFQQTERALNSALADQRNLKFMLSVTKNLFSDMHLTSMIEQMTMQVHHLLKADDCALYLVNVKTREFYLAKDESDPQVRRHKLTVGIVGHVASTGATVRISSNAMHDARFHPDVDQRKGKVTHSILCCPIKSDPPEGSGEEAQVIGVIEVRDEKDRGGFEAEEEKLLKVFCAQAAVAITSAQKFSAIMDRTEPKNSDHDAAEYLKGQRGMNLASDDIGSFEYKMDEIQLKGAIGTGSYGEVYRALVRSKIVAVKKLHVRNLKAEQVDAFCKEASLMCQLNHQNVVQFIGAVTEPSNLCIITQFCARGSLADLLLDENIQMSIARKLKFALDAARGMHYLHSSNPVILHRDLKSDNLLVGRDWTVKVGDFGLTRFLSEKKAMTQVGTPMWMAPEIIIGKQYTEKADVYAFGIILWEILTRLEPYEDKEPMQIVVEVVNDNLRPTIPEEFKASPLVPLMKDCWNADFDQRPTFSIVVERLQKLFEEEIKIHPLEKEDLPDEEDPQHPGDNPNNKRPSRGNAPTGAPGAGAGAGGKDSKTPPPKSVGATATAAAGSAPAAKPAGASAAGAPPLGKQPSMASSGPKPPGGK